MSDDWGDDGTSNDWVEEGSNNESGFNDWGSSGNEHTSHGSSEEYTDITGERSMGDDWLASRSESSEYGADERSAQNGVQDGYMGATQRDLKLGQLGHMEPRIQQAAAALASGGSIRGISSLDSMAAVEQFGEDIQGSPSEAVKGLNINASQVAGPVTQIDPNTMQATKTFQPELLNSAADKSLLLGLFNDSTGYLDRGPGGKLAGHTNDPDKRSKMEADLAEADAIVAGLADLYLHDATKGSTIYGARKQSVVNDLTNRLMDGVFSPGAATILPTPNEIPTKGLVPTMAASRRFDVENDYSPNTGTALTRLEFANVAAERGWTEEDDAYWQHMPSNKHSLFGLPKKKGRTGVDMDIAKRGQEFKYQQAISNAHKARDIYRKNFPTLTDETEGQIRMSGYHRPYGEQADRMNTINEASIQGLEYGQASTEVSESQFNLEISSRVGKGSDRDGMYGKDSLSEIDVALEKAEEFEEVKEEIEGIEQHTPEWHKARKEMVTASILTNQSGKMLSAEDLAIRVGVNRLKSSNEKWLGNSFTREGSEGESKALASFLAKMKADGNEMVHTEVGLLQNPDLPGMGASPDGRLAGMDGENKGLLELKFLTPGAMKGALKKYSPQMQLQMAVTREEETHFYALDKLTGESIHEVVKADPAFQKDMIGTINEAIELQAGQDARGVRKMKQTAAQRRTGATSEDETGQTESADLTPEQQQAMPSYGSDGESDVVGIDVSKAVIAHQNKTGGAAEGAAFDEMRKVDSEGAADKAAKAKATSADKEAAKASDEAAKSIAELGKSAKKAGKIMGELAGLVTGGTASIMDEERAASTAGMSIEDARGARRELQEAGLSIPQSAAAISAAGAITNQLAADPDAVGGMLERLTKASRGPGASEQLRGLALPDASQLLGMDAKERMADVLRMVNAVDSDKDKAAIATAAGVPQLATAEGLSSVDLMAAKDERSGDRISVARLTAKGIEAARGMAEDLKETASQAGEYLGFGARAVETGGAIAGSATVGAVAYGVATSTSIGPATAAAAVATKGMLASAALPVAAVAAGAGIGYLAAKPVNAMINKFDDMAGTTIAGSAIAHTLAFFGNDEAQDSINRMNDIEGVPSESLDVTSIAAPRASSTSAGATNNIDVNVSVDPNMVQVATNVNGDEYNDMELGYA